MCSSDLGHIPGAWYGVRSRVNEFLPQLPAKECIVFTSQEGSLAKLAAMDAKAAVPVFVLDGGTAAWRAGGHALEQGATHMAVEPDDIRLKAREQSKDIEAAMHAYLSWEIELVNQMAVDDDQRFQVMCK